MSTALILGVLPTDAVLVTSILDYYRPNKVFLCGSRELNSKARSWAYQSYRPYQLSDTDVFRDPIPNLILTFDTEGYRAYEIVFNPTKKVSD